MMDQLIMEFPAQLQEALEIGQAAKLSSPTHTVKNVYIAGLGGSGIGADFVRSFVKKDCPVPIIIGKGYEIPMFVDEHTLAICSSYSGNTEETLSAYRKLSAQGAKVVVISSGGTLISEAKRLDLDHIQVPQGSPSPRACLGYSIVQQLFVLFYHGFIDGSFKSEIRAASDLLNFDQSSIQDAARKVAERLTGKIPIIYAVDTMEPVAVRLRQQINENAKMLCWHHVIPEMNHNELVGWTEKHQDKAVVYLRNKDDYKRNQIRMDINQKIISQYTDNTVEIYSKGNSFIEKALYLVHLGDWVSWYLSEMQGVDAIQIKVIDYLKAELAKVDI